MRKSLYYLFITFLTFTVGWFCYVTFLQVYPFRTAKINVLPIPIVTKQVRVGETLQWKTNVEQYTTGIKVDVIKQLQCTDSILNLPTTSYITHKGHQEFINKSFIVPASTPIGKCKVVSDSQFHLNSLRTITLHAETEEFEVTK